MNNKITLNLPPFLNIKILNNNNKLNKIIYIYNNIYYIYFKINSKKNTIYYNFEINSINISLFIINKNIIKNTNYLSTFLKSLNIYFFFKIKFKGKGYRIRFYKKNKIVKFYFGKSHPAIFFFKNIILKKVSKYKFVIKGKNLNSLKTTSLEISKIKPSNIYTLRGLRLSRQKIYKRKGKKGSYI
jgi:ribosomal protein L6P/L9E